MEEQRREQNIGRCDKCGMEFQYDISHTGWGYYSYAYCDKCGKTAFLQVFSQKAPEKIKKRQHMKKISEDMEQCIEQCSCGGSFKHDALPRCPTCNNTLSAEAAREYIERNAPGTKKGWQWQGNWDDLYAIVIENNMIEDNWNLYPPEPTPKRENTNFPFMFLLILCVIAGSLASRLPVILSLNSLKKTILYLFIIFIIWVFAYSSFGKWLNEFLMKRYKKVISSMESIKKR